jgi:amino acid transporter
LTGLSVFQLRRIDGATPRPFRVPLYPITPIIFCLTCAYMLYSSLMYAKALSLLGIIPLLIGLPLYFLGRK